MRLSRWYGWLAHWWDAVRGSFWFFPAQMAVLAGGLALAAIEVDRAVPASWLASVPWLTNANAAGARAVLTTVAGSMMTVTSVVFSITVVALTLTSSQFGPRLLRTFFRDRGSQIALGTFISTFCYSLLVLRAVAGSERVPYLATAIAVALAVASLFVLIFFVHHAASSIQASSVIAAVADEIHEALATLFPERLGEEPEAPLAHRDAERLARLEGNGAPLHAPRDGYVCIVNDEEVFGLARDHDLLIRADAHPGDFVIRGATVARVDPAEDLGDEVREQLESCWILGDHRTPVQDFCFLTGQLSEMAVRALSPGVNDPKTAVECIHRLASVVARLASRSMPSGLRCDDEGVLRLVVEPTRFEAVVASCFDAIRRYGIGDPQVAVALLGAVEAGARRCSDAGRLGVLQEHALEIHAGYVGARDTGSKRDRALVEAAFERASSALQEAASAEGAAG